MESGVCELFFPKYVIQLQSWITILVFIFFQFCKFLPSQNLVLHLCSKNQRNPIQNAKPMHIYGKWVYEFFFPKYVIQLQSWITFLNFIFSQFYKFLPSQNLLLHLCSKNQRNPIQNAKPMHSYAKWGCMSIFSQIFYPITELNNFFILHYFSGL